MPRKSITSGSPTPIVCACGCGREFAPKPRRHVGVTRFIVGHNNTAPLTERFWRHVLKTETCWLWTGGKTSAGYGCISKGRGAEHSIHLGAHRVSYELHFGPIPEDSLVVCHSCDVKACVNPSHLFLGTYTDNATDMVAKGRCNPPHGDRHPLSKLSTVKVAEMRQLHLTGKVTISSLARMYNIDQSTASVAIARKTWKSVP